MAWTYNTPEGTPTDGPRIVALALTFTSLALIALSLRLYVRVWLLRAMGLDDWAVIVGWVGACGYTICTVIQTKWGLGLHHLKDMPDENIYNFGHVQYTGAPFYVVGIWGFKISLLLSYLRYVTGNYRVVPIVMATMITMAHISFFCVFLFLCTPVQKQWDPTITYGHCGQAVTFYLTFSALTLLFDIIVFLLPFPLLFKLQMQLRRRLVLVCLFAFGLFVTIIQIIRIQTIRNLSNYLDSAKPIQWSIVENNVGIIITCVPTLAPLVKYFSERNSRNASGEGSAGSKKPDSRPYHMHSWRGGVNDGMRPLGSSGGDKVPVATAAKASGGSTEDILRQIDAARTSLDGSVEEQPLPFEGRAL